MHEQHKNIVITGGNAGIGLQTARGLFGDGHHIIFGSRNEQKNIDAVRDISKTFPTSAGSIVSCKLDLSKRESIESFVQFIKGKFEHIDILINNAGLIINERTISQLGIEMTLTINHFGPFYLTYLLFPLMRQVKDGRIINVSSIGHYYSPPGNPISDLTASKGYKSLPQYQKTKLANVMFTAGLAQRLRQANLHNIKTMSLHPGAVYSDFGKDNLSIRIYNIICCCLYVDNETGARTSLFLSRTNFEDLRSGEYYNDNTKWKEMNKMGRNIAEVDRLWRVTEEAYGIKFDVK